jgi:hypothetical protein
VWHAIASATSETLGEDDGRVKDAELSCGEPMGALERLDNTLQTSTRALPDGRGTGQVAWQSQFFSAEHSTRPSDPSSGPTAKGLLFSTFPAVRRLSFILRGTTLTSSTFLLDNDSNVASDCLRFGGALSSCFPCPFAPTPGWSSGIRADRTSPGDRLAVPALPMRLPGPATRGVLRRPLFSSRLPERIHQHGQAFLYSSHRCDFLAGSSS